MYIMTETVNLVYHIFPTPFFFWENCNLDIERLEKDCLDFMNNTPSVEFSNVGGYQGHNFKNEQLFSFIQKNIPHNEIKKIKKFKIKSWLNVNKKNSYNERHSHDPHSGTYLSGVFYVKCPELSGSIRFYDPRPHISSAPDMEYLYDGKEYEEIIPQENMMLMFPSWLEHDVQMNKTNKERISISFNIIDIEY